MKSPVIEKLEAKIAKLKRQLEEKDARIQALELERLEMREAIRRAARVQRPGEFEK